MADRVAEANACLQLRVHSSTVEMLLACEGCRNWRLTHQPETYICIHKISYS